MCCEHVYEVLSAKVLHKSTLPSHEFEMLFVCVPIYIYIYIYNAVGVYVGLCMHMCIYMCACVCVCVRTHTHTHTQTCVLNHTEYWMCVICCTSNSQHIVCLLWPHLHMHIECIAMHDHIECIVCIVHHFLQQQAWWMASVAVYLVTMVGNSGIHFHFPFNTCIQCVQPTGSAHASVVQHCIAWMQC